MERKQHKTKRSRTAWTEEQDEQVMRMVRNKVPYKQIAKRVGRTHTSINQRVVVLKKREAEMRDAGVPTRARTSWSDADTATMLEMKQNGSSDEEIAAALGRTKHAITVRLGRVRRAKVETETTPIQPTATVSGTEAIDFITEAVVERAAPELIARYREEMNNYHSTLVTRIEVELKPIMERYVENVMWRTFESFRQTWDEERDYITRKEMLDHINKAVQQEFALATYVEEPEPKPTRAERRAERRAAKKQAKIERLQQRIQEMSE